jgi:putative ABC transport system permease protein
MILQEALGLGIIGFIIGKAASTLWAPAFPRHLEFLPQDTVAAFALTVAICVLGSLVGIRAALKVQPASAIGG